MAPYLPRTGGSAGGLDLHGCNPLRDFIPWCSCRMLWCDWDRVAPGAPALCFDCNRCEGPGRQDEPKHACQTNACANVCRFCGGPLPFVDRRCWAKGVRCGLADLPMQCRAECGDRRLDRVEAVATVALLANTVSEAGLAHAGRGNTAHAYGQRFPRGAGGRPRLLRFVGDR